MFKQTYHFQSNFDSPKEHIFQKIIISNICKKVLVHEGDLNCESVPLFIATLVLLQKYVALNTSQDF